jgi:large subunit ribosomal protein L21
MYAVVKVKGRQVRVEPDRLVRVPRIAAEPGSQVPIEEVLLIGIGDTSKIGKPQVTGARVLAEVVRHGRGPKIEASKYKRRKDYRRRWGSREEFTELRIHAIEGAE